MFCQHCGSSNDDSVRFCSNCGNALVQATGTFPPARAATGAPDSVEDYYRAAVGTNNQDYYLRKFSRFDNDGKTGVSWHWPAFFVTFYWFLYRKMWRNALIYFLLPYLVLILFGIIGAMAGKSAEAVVGIAYLLFLVTLFLIPPMFANAWYYKHCKNKISSAKASSTDRQRQLGELSGRGGTSNIILILVLVFGFIIVIGILAAIAIPAYQDYVTRARTTDAAAFGTRAAESVAQYYYQHKQAPSSLEQSGFANALPQSVKQVSVDAQNGMVTLTLSGGPLDGKTLLMQPSLDANKQITWKCLSQEIQDRQLPRQCRKQQ